jgi:thiol-disulfide isomerase/thioredoxin
MLKNLIAATLYTALSLGAIPATAQDMQSVMELRDGSLQKLGFHSEPKEVSTLPFMTMEGDEETVTDYAGKLVLLNFWATWCAPCRKEMPALDALSTEFGNKGFVVLPIATGHNPTPAIEKFFETAQIKGLTPRLDPKGAMARDMGVLGLPVSILISPQCQEIARMTGDAEWFSPSAQAIVAKLLKEYDLTNDDSAETH